MRRRLSNLSFFRGPVEIMLEFSRKLSNCCNYRYYCSYQSRRRRVEFWLGSVSQKQITPKKYSERRWQSDPRKKPYTENRQNKKENIYFVKCRWRSLSFKYGLLQRHLILISNRRYKTAAVLEILVSSYRACSYKKTADRIIRSYKLRRK